MTGLRWHNRCFVGSPVSCMQWPSIPNVHCAAAVRHASATSAEFASALSPTPRISGDATEVVTAAAAGDHEGFLSRSAALLKKGSRRVTDRGGSLLRASATGEAASHVITFS